nr:hypothetical protein [Pandoravirus belohorizontensis]
METDEEPRASADMPPTTTMPTTATTSLADLPPEILLAIAQQLASTSVRYAVVWSSIVGLALPPCVLADAVLGAAVRIAAHRFSHPKSAADQPPFLLADVVHEIVGLGAPLAVVERIVGHDRSVEFVVAAATGGRADVLAWAWSRANLAPNAWYPRHLFGTHGPFNDALRGAMRHDRREILVWLLERKIEDRADVAQTYDDLLRFALDRGHADVVDAVHRAQSVQHGMDRFWKPCLCDQSILRHALDRGRVDALDILERAGCHLASTITLGHLARAVRKGHADAVRWTAARLVAPTVSDLTMAKAAARGHVAVVALVHDTGLGTCTPQAIERAIVGGHVNVLDWATGGGDAPPARPVAPWFGPHLPYVAVRFGRSDVLAWMARRPDMAGALTVGVARRAIVSGHWPCAIVLHDCGAVSVGSWNALATAVRYASTEGLAAVAERGAQCTVEAMAAALCHASLDPVAYLCRHFGHGDLQAAIDAVAGLVLGREPVAWVAANVPAVCVAQLAHQQRGSTNATAHAVCRCVRCLS